MMREEKKRVVVPDDFSGDINKRHVDIIVWDGTATKKISGTIRNSKYMLKVYPDDDPNNIIYLNKAFVVEVIARKEDVEKKEEKEEKAEEKKEDEETRAIREKIEDLLGIKGEASLAEIASLIGKSMEETRKTIEEMNNPFIKISSDKVTAAINESTIVVNKVRNKLYEKGKPTRLDVLAAELNMPPSRILGAISLNKRFITDVKTEIKDGEVILKIKEEKKGGKKG